MRIYDLKTVESNGDVEVSVLIDSAKFERERLWFSTSEKFRGCLCTNRMDGFLVGMLFPAMQWGENIHIEGVVSKKLLFNLNNYVVPLLMAFSSSSKRIEISAAAASGECFGFGGVGTGFSAGVDSFCTIYDRLELESDPAYKVNSFLFLNVGSHGPGGTEEEREFAYKKFKNRFEYLSSFPKELGIEFIPLHSNLHYFHPWGHQRTHTLTSASGVLMLQSYFARYYYASSGVDYKDLMTNADRYKDIDIGEFCDPILLPLLSTESLELIADGTQYTRAEKTLRIADYVPAQKYLNVCVGSEGVHGNCSVCSKCCRTLMALKSAGKLQHFAHLFDVDKYENRAEHKYVCRQVLSQNKDPFARANIQLARQNGVRLPGYIASFLTCLPGRVRTVLMKHIPAKG